MRYISKFRQFNLQVLCSAFNFSFSTTISTLCALCVLCGSISLPVDAQVRPIYDQGALGLGQLLKRLNNTKSVMMIGAHPDDEDSGLLAYLARGENARTAYLSLTRGDGGQNRLGKELFEPLGIIRTEELLQARTLDGAEQFFTRAFDYGYSKTLAEAKSKWDEKIILCDVVSAIRFFQPLVVISRFSGTPRDGHGQHQYAGYISKPAVEAAADPNQCKNAGNPWKVKKFYRSFRSRNEKPTVRMNTGKYDRHIGRSYFQIAIQGRSQHKSQEQGFLELKGDRFSQAILVESSVPKVENETSIFDGIDTSLENFPKTIGLSGEIETEDFKKLGDLARKANNAFIKNDFAGVANYLKKGLASSISIWEGLFDREKLLKRRKSQSIKHLSPIFNYALFLRRDFLKAIKLSTGLQIDAISNREMITNGENFTTSVKVFFPEDSGIKIKSIELLERWGFEITEGKEIVDNSRFGRFFRETARVSKTFNIKVSKDPKYTQPYFLEKKKEGYLYKLDKFRGSRAPFLRPILWAKVIAEIDGQEIRFGRPVEYRKRDPLRGELRRNLNVVPKVSLDLDQHLLVVPKGSKPQKRTVSLNVLSNSSIKSVGKATLNVPKGWRVSPSSVDVVLGKKGESASYDFEVTIPANTKADGYRLKAVANIDGKKFDQTMNTVAYDHIQTHRYYTKAETKVNVFDLKTSNAKIGYIMGSGDQIPEAIRQMGFDVDLLNKKYLTNGDFSRYDTIVVGIRASETRNDYIANNARLLKYVEQGGTLVVQYQKFAFLRNKLAPFPARYNARVAEEDAKITILEPNHPVFNFPNKITQKDFKNWVQERNLYAFKTFDKKYTPLLESHDTGEPENKGGMVYAEIGKGKYMYCSYSFFRQLPAGVPGAYRLFSNILSLSKAKK